MNIVKSENRLCPCCMEEHEVKTVHTRDQMTFKNQIVSFLSEYYYCDRADEYYADETQMSENDIRMKNEYRKMNGLLTSEEICAIRSKYGISQSDLCILLDWGGKTVTRYENHQVQDKAHDAILRKLNSDPAWFLELLEKAKMNLSEASYRKYQDSGRSAYEESRDYYLRKSIEAEYAVFSANPANNGDTTLSFDKVADTIAFFANSTFVKTLYKVKLMKLLWYSDALSYKRTGHAITGLVYAKMPMGALPFAHESIIDLKGVCYEEVDFGEGSGYHFIKNKENTTYNSLTKEEKSILLEVAKRFGALSKDALVNLMHKERAYIETAPRDIIQFKYAKYLSI